MAFGVSGFQSQAITYPDDYVKCEYPQKKTVKGFVLYQTAHEALLFLLGMLIFSAKDLSLRQPASNKRKRKQDH
mgnify:CR=1 FL=1